MSIDVTLRCVHVYPKSRECAAEDFDHVHGPTPCRNGHDERHHPFWAPKSVTLRIAGQLYRVRLRSPE